MHPAASDLPTSLTTLDDLFEDGDSSERPYKVFVGHNLGNRTFQLLVPMHEFFKISEVANETIADGENVAQRKLDPVHAGKLAVYTLKGLISAAIERRKNFKLDPLPVLSTLLDRLGRQSYLSLQPLVANIRGVLPGGKDIRGERIKAPDNSTASFSVFLSQRHVLWVIDGQHRRMAMKLVFDFLDHVTKQLSYPAKGSLYPFEKPAISSDEAQAWQECYETARSFCTVAVEVHMGLTVAQERQLFHDLNNLGKKVDKNLALSFDRSNPVTLFIADCLSEQLNMKIADREIRDWKDDDGSLSLKEVVAINAILFLNKTNISGAVVGEVSAKLQTAKRFWEAVSAISGFGESGAKERTVAAQPVVIKALAKLCYDFAFSPRKSVASPEDLEKLLAGISDLDFSHDNPMWRYYSFSESERLEFGFHKLSEYLPDPSSGNRDIGLFQNGLMRFGSKHNDIIPILGDMIRWRLGLRNRRGLSIEELMGSIGLPATT